MIIKVETAQEMALIREGKTTSAVITDRARRTRPGNDLKFWIGDPRTKRREQGAMQFASGKVSDVTDFEIRHSVQGMQKEGALYISGYKLGHDDTFRVAVKLGFRNVREMFHHFNYEYTGRLVSWKEVTPAE